jgi:hypothetical protein
LKLIKVNYDLVYSNDRKVLKPQECITLHIMKNLEVNDFQYALFKINDNEHRVLDVVQIKNFI